MQIFAAAVSGISPGFMHAGYVSASKSSFVMPTEFQASVGTYLTWLAVLIAAGLLVYLAVRAIRRRRSGNELDFVTAGSLSESRSRKDNVGPKARAPAVGLGK